MTGRFKERAMEAVTQTMVNYMGSGAAWVIRLFLAVVVLIIGYISRRSPPR